MKRMGKRYDVRMTSEGPRQGPDTVYRERLPAVEVGHTVTWVNTALNRKGSGSPYKFQKGRRSPLGLFLVTSADTTATHLSVMPGHGRVALMGRVVFRDNKGRVYRDLDLKGIGHVMFPDAAEPDGTLRMQALAPEKAAEQGAGVWGILGAEDAQKDADYGELFAKAGVRAVRTLAIMELHEIATPDGTKVPIGEALARWYQGTSDNTPENRPVVSVRVYGVQARAGEHHRIYELPAPVEETKERAKAVVEDALAFVETYEYSENERGVRPHSPERVKAYLEWFIRELAVSVARMHQAGYYHGQIAPFHRARVPANVTLDARLVDFDTSGKLSDLTDDEPENAKLIDRFAALGALDDLMKTLAFVYGDKGEFAFLATNQQASDESFWFDAMPWVRERFISAYASVTGETLNPDNYTS